MQGRLIIGAILLGGMVPAAHAAEQVKRPSCEKVEPAQPRPQQGPVHREKAQDCKVPRNIPPVVDPTPSFLL